MFGRRHPRTEELRLDLFADYFQIHLSDEGSLGDLSEAWDNEATARRLAVADGILGIGTGRNVDVPVLLRVLEREPPRDVSEWESLVEGDIECRSGRLVVMGCTDDYTQALRVPVPKGWLRVRSSARGLGTIVAEWEPADDEYRIELWPEARPAGVNVIKIETA